MERERFKIETLFQLLVLSHCWGPVLAVGEPFTYENFCVWSKRFPPFPRVLIFGEYVCIREANLILLLAKNKLIKWILELSFQC